MARIFQRGGAEPLSQTIRPGLILVRNTPRRLPDGISQRQQVIIAALRCHLRHREPEHLPAPRNRQPLGVNPTQVVAVWFSVGGQRAENSSGVRIDVRQGGDSRLLAPGSRTLTYLSHD